MFDGYVVTTDGQIQVLKYNHHNEGWVNFNKLMINIRPYLKPIVGRDEYGSVSLISLEIKEIVFPLAVRSITLVGCKFDNVELSIPLYSGSTARIFRCDNLKIRNIMHWAASDDASLTFGIGNIPTEGLGFE